MKAIGSNVRMPLIGIGTWLYNDSVAAGAVESALSLGYRHVDTALGYKNQRGVGDAIARSGVARDDLFVTTKIPGGLNASATEAALDECLAELQLTYVDLMLIHWPGATELARKEQWLALETWARKGKTRAIGVSHYCKSHVAEVLQVATLPVSLNQNQYHVGMGGDTQPRLHDKAFCESKGILFMAYSSLCGPCPPPDNMALINGPLVTSIGAAHNRTGAQVALRWVVQQGTPVIPKSTNPKHIAQNFDLFDFNLTAAEMARLTSVTSPPETGTPAAPDDAQDCPAHAAA
jgi:diketogulonate reductase-like aldo/keto reductase